MTHSARVPARQDGAARRRAAQRAASTATLAPPLGQHATTGPASIGPAEIVALQRTVGNRATIRLLRPVTAAQMPRPAVQRQPLTAEQKRYAALKKLGAGGQQAAKPRDLATPVLESLSYGAELVSAPADALGGFGDAEVVDDPYAEEPEILAEVGDADDRDHLKAVSGGLGVAGGLLAVGGGITTIAMLAKRLKSAQGWERAEAGVDLAGQSSAALFSTLQTGATATGTAAKAYDLDQGSDAAAMTSDISGGIGEIFGTIGAAFETVIRGAKGIIGIVKAVRSTAGNKKETLVEAVTDLLGAGKSLLVTFKSTIGTISTFLQVAKTAGEFVQAVPFIGGAFNILAQAVDILMQGVKVVTQVVKMAGSWLQAQAMKAAAGLHQGQTLLQYLSDINRKRFRRAFIPLSAAITTVVADVLSIGGSILNMVGTATASAMGAGGAILAVGYGTAAFAGAMKLGAASLKPAAWAVRTSKQKLRDKAGNSNSRLHKKLNKKVFGKRLFNTDKTTQKKNQERDAAVNNLLTHVMALPDEQTINALQTRDQRMVALMTVIQVQQMIEATGVDPEKLAAAEDIEDVKAQLRTAMKARD